jgi:hypothetical protein
MHLHFDALGQLEEEALRFPEEDVEEARKMIERLITRTELALNKHHNAKKNMIAQENKALAQAIAQNSSSVALTGTPALLMISLLMAIWSFLSSSPRVCTKRYLGDVQYHSLNHTRVPLAPLPVGGLAKISTMELIKETVDIEEQNDLEELYFLWDEAIQLYELEEFPGDYEVSMHGGVGVERVCEMRVVFFVIFCSFSTRPACSFFSPTNGNALTGCLAGAEPRGGELVHVPQPGDAAPGGGGADAARAQLRRAHRQSRGTQLISSVTDPTCYCRAGLGSLSTWAYFVVVSMYPL